MACHISSWAAAGVNLAAGALVPACQHWFQHATDTSSNRQWNVRLAGYSSPHVEKLFVCYAPTPGNTVRTWEESYDRRFHTREANRAIALMRPWRENVIAKLRDRETQRRLQEAAAAEQAALAARPQATAPQQPVGGQAGRQQQHGFGAAGPQQAAAAAARPAYSKPHCCLLSCSTVCTCLLQLASARRPRPAAEPQGVGWPAWACQVEWACHLLTA